MTAKQLRGRYGPRGEVLVTDKTDNWVLLPAVVYALAWVAAAMWVIW